MNKSKHPMAANIQKKMKKELRITSQTKPIVSVDDNKEQTELSSPRNKTIKKTANSKTKAPIKGKKQPRLTHDNRAESDPQIVHLEGQRWIKTLNKQAAAKRKVFTKHMNKERSK